MHDIEQPAAPDDVVLTARTDALTAAQAGDFAQAAALLAPHADATHPAVQVEYGVALARMGHPCEALEMFLGVSQDSPHGVQATVNAGLLAHDIEMPSLACKLFDRLVGCSDGLPPQVRITQARALARCNREGDALAIVSEILSQATDSLQIKTLIELSEVMSACGLDDEAVKLLRAAFPEAYGVAEVHLRLADCLHRLGRHDAAAIEASWRTRLVVDDGAPWRHLPAWIGDRLLAGRRVLLHADGDLTETTRDLGLRPLLEALGASVGLVAPAAIADALPELGWLHAPDPADFDFRCRLGALHFLLRRPVEALAPGRPFLARGTPPAGTEVWVQTRNRAGLPDDAMDVLADALQADGHPLRRVGPGELAGPTPAVLVARHSPELEVCAARGTPVVAIVEADAPWHWLPAGPSCWYGPQAVSVRRIGPMGAWVRHVRAVVKDASRNRT